MRTSFFAGARPGELLYSALARHSVVRGGSGPKAVMAELFGRPSAIATPDLPNGLADLVARLPPEFGVGVPEIIKDHTLLPYYTAFQPMAVRERAAAAMAGRAGSVHLLLGAAAFRTGRPKRLRFCPECLTDMSGRWGTWHWMRAHQPPGAVVCHVHATDLRWSTVELAAVNRHGFVAATRRTCQSEAPSVLPGLDAATRELAVDIARASTLLLEQPCEAVGRDARRKVYLAEIARVGLLRGQFKVNQVELASRLSEHWSGLLDFLDGVQLDVARETWLASLVRRPTGAQPPLQHLLLTLFLDAQPDAPVRLASRPYVERRRPRSAAPRRTAARRPLVDWTEVDLAYATTIRREAASLVDELPPRRVTLGAIEGRLGRRDWLAKRRGKLPVSCRAAAAVEESIEAFRLRRLRWHAFRHANSGEFSPWVVLRAAGLPRAFIQVVRDEFALLSSAARRQIAP